MVTARECIRSGAAGTIPQMTTPLSRTALSAAAIGLLVLLLLLPRLAADPDAGLTRSNAPLSDEGYNTVNARNLVLLGNPSADDWNRHLLSPTATAVQIPAFAVAGVGIETARLPDILATALTAAGLTLLVATVLGSGAGIAAGLGFATCALVLGYGRLAFLEPLLDAALVAALAAVVRPTRRPRLLGALAGAALVAAVGVKLLALVPALGIGVVVVWMAWRHADGRVSLRWLGVGAGLAALPWAALALTHLPELRLTAATLPPLAITLDASELRRRVLNYLQHGADDGAFAMTLPLLVAAGAGTLAGLARWRSATPRARALLLGAITWAVLATAELAVVAYRPSRYFLAVVPALAVLAGFCVPTLQAAAARLPRPVAIVGIVSAMVLMSGPGLVSHGPLSAAPPSTLPQIQADVASVIPGGSTVYGAYAATFAMRVRGAIVTPWGADGFNPSDLYATAGVRWLILANDEQPAWMQARPEIWTARQEVLCRPWGPHHICLVHLGG